MMANPSPSPLKNSGTDAVEAAGPFTHLPSQLRFWIPAVLILLLDLWSKHAAFVRLAPDEVRTVIPGLLEFRRSLNDGAVFGSFTGYVGLFVVASMFALGFVLYLFAHSTRRQWVIHVVLGLVLAGALGNLYDRVYMKADVVTVEDEEGRPRSFIGRIVSEADDPVLRVGDWPEGTNPRLFDPESVNVRRQGVVRDFLKFTPLFPKFIPIMGGFDVWPWVFNVADAALVVGVIVLLLHGLFDRRESATS